MPDDMPVSRMLAARSIWADFADLFFAPGSVVLKKENPS